MATALNQEDGAALNGLIRAQDYHLRRSLLGIAGVSQLRIVQSDLHTLFLKMNGSLLWAYMM